MKFSRHLKEFITLRSLVIAIVGIYVSQVYVPRLRLHVAVIIISELAMQR